jgi:hypothetical protein
VFEAFRENSFVTELLVRGQKRENGLCGWLAKRSGNLT